MLDDAIAVKMRPRPRVGVNQETASTKSAKYNLGPIMLQRTVRLVWTFDFVQQAKGKKCVVAELKKEKKTSYCEIEREK